jgi:hypothetical protein
MVEEQIQSSLHKEECELQAIHQGHVNIAIFPRSMADFQSEIDALVEESIEINASGSITDIMRVINLRLASKSIPHIVKDIADRLTVFQQITNGTTFKLLLATVNTIMCKRFHADVNDIRLLCTYSGPGTLWLANEYVNREALQTFRPNEEIVIKDSAIRQVPTGAVALLKGAVYPNIQTQPVVHRSPTIAESGTKRLLLRIDTNE